MMTWINEKGIECYDCKTCVFYPWDCPSELQKKGCIFIDLENGVNDAY